MNPSGFPHAAAAFQLEYTAILREAVAPLDSERLCQADHLVVLQLKVRAITGRTPFPHAPQVRQNNGEPTELLSCGQKDSKHDGTFRPLLFGEWSATSDSLREISSSTVRVSGGV